MGSHLCLSSGTCRQDRDAFKTEPMDTIASEGETAIFTCVVENFSSGADSISWSLEPFHDHEVAAEFDDKKHVMTSKLLLHNISKTDHYVTCMLNRTVESISGENQLNCFLSEEAKLIVHYFPKRHEISCHPRESPLQTEGSMISLRCEVMRCNPAVDIYWEFNYDVPDIHLPRPRLTDNGHTRVSRLDFPVSKQMHLRSLTCIVTSELAFPEKILQCSVGPIHVLYPPTVFVNPASIVLNSYQTQLECLSDGSPNNFTFSWSCSPADIFNGCEANSQKINIFINDLYKSSNSAPFHMIVTCTVSNSVGTGTASSLINAERWDSSEDQPNSINESSTSCDHDLSNFTVRGIYIEKPTQKMSRFQCIFNRDMATQTQVIYNKDDMSTLEFSLDQELPLQNVFLQLLIISKSNFEDIVACEITSCNHTQLTLAQIVRFHPVLEKDISSSQLSESNTSNNSDLDATKELPNNMDNSQAQFVWQTASITMASVLSIIILIACLAMMKYALRHKYKHGSENRLENSPETFQKMDNQHDELSMPDPIYEMPLDRDATSADSVLKPAIDTSSMDYLQAAHHIYESRVHHALSPGETPESSYQESSPTHVVHSYYAVEGLQIAENSDPSHTVIYNNDHVVQMHSKDKNISSSTKMIMVDNNKYETPLPKIPLKANDKDNSNLDFHMEKSTPQ